MTIFRNTRKIKSALQREPTELCKRTQGRWNPRAPADSKHSRDCRARVRRGQPHPLADAHWGMSDFSSVLNDGSVFQILPGLPQVGFFIEIANMRKVKTHYEVRLDATVRERARATRLALTFQRVLIEPQLADDVPGNVSFDSLAFFGMAFCGFQ